jgi:pyruvate formate-lyase activating enzyme-like uncharacterized protein
MAYNSIIQKIDIQNTKGLAGWAYYEMKWLTESEARKANLERNKLLKSISGRVSSNFLGNKIGAGTLSPGCSICGQGTWSCLFIGSLCTANCFYCPQDRKTKEDHPPTESGLLFDNPDDYVDYLEKFKFKGVGFSGGEPLLKYKEILTYIKKIRERLGNEIYLWVYTNGDLVDKNKLKALKRAGLNELRFDISARSYDLKIVEMAAGIIDTVTIEIPAIPEEYEILKECLPEMRAIGVAHLNLHQLHASHHCYKKFIARGYTFLHQSDTPVLESEMTALRIIKYVLDNDIGLPINYCSTIYKNRFQKKGYRERCQSFVKEQYEGLTESGFIRRLAIQDTPVNIKKLIKIFQGKKCHKSLWFYDKKQEELFVHQSLLKYIDFNKHDLDITYCAPQLTEIRDEYDENSKEVVLNPRRKIFTGKKIVYQTKIKNPVTATGFQELFVEKKNNGDVFKRFYTDYDLRTKTDIDDMMDEKERLDYLKTWEFIGSGLSEIY